MSDAPHDVGLRRAVRRSGFFTLSFGAVIGSGWVVVLGEWLRSGGPGGSSLGFLFGGLAMTLIALCYGELAARCDRAGGEFIYTLRAFGPFAAFLVGWFLTLFQIAVCGFEAISLAWMLRNLVPGIALPTAYTLAGYPVTWDALITGAVGCVVIGLMHWRGAAAAIRFQNIVTFGFIGASVVLIGCGLSLGSIANLQPLFSDMSGNSWMVGTLWTFATSAFFLNGWQAGLHAIEERDAKVTVPSAIAYIIAGLAAATLFYVLIITSTSMAVPWQSLLTRELPAAAAFRALGGGGILGALILVAAIVSLSKTWSATAWIASRLLFAQARHGLLPRALASLETSSQAPRNAILVVTLFSLCEVALGRGAILPIVDMLSICSALSIILCLGALLRSRRKDSAAQVAFRVPGGTFSILLALASAIVMVAIALLRPVFQSGGQVPLQWLLLALWAILGTGVWRAARRHVAVSEIDIPAA